MESFTNIDGVIRPVHVVGVEFTPIQVGRSAVNLLPDRFVSQNFRDGVRTRIQNNNGDSPGLILFPKEYADIDSATEVLVVQTAIASRRGQNPHVVPTLIQLAYVRRNTILIPTWKVSEPQVNADPANIDLIRVDVSTRLDEGLLEELASEGVVLPFANPNIRRFPITSAIVMETAGHNTLVKAAGINSERAGVFAYFRQTLPGSRSEFYPHLRVSRELDQEGIRFQTFAIPARLNRRR